jgi:hypothetical protein
MLTDFVFRYKKKIASFAVCACLLACFWAGSGREAVAPTKNTNPEKPCEGLLDSERFASVWTKALYHNGVEQIAEAEKNVSTAVGHELAAPKMSSMTPQWPPQSARAFRSAPSSKELGTIFRAPVENRFSVTFSGSSTQNSSSWNANPGGSESFGINQLGEFRLQEAHEYSAASQGSVLVNF